MRFVWGLMAGLPDPRLPAGPIALDATPEECAALAAMPAPKVPAICALGTAEKVVDVPPVHLRMAGWAAGRLDLYPGAEHEVMMEQPAHRNRFFDAADALFSAHR